MIQKTQFCLLTGEISNLPGLVWPGQTKELTWDLSETYLQICIMTCLFLLWVDLQGGEGGGLPSKYTHVQGTAG